MGQADRDSRVTSRQAVIGNLLARAGVGRLGVSSIVMTSGMLFRGMVVAIYLVMTTRWLGEAEYGRFAAVVATVMVLAPAGGWGAGQVLLRRASGTQAGISSLWSTSLLQVLVAGCLLLFPVVLFNLALPSSPSVLVVLLVGIAELIAIPVTITAASALQAVGRFGGSALVICLVPSVRLLAVLLALESGLDGTVWNVVLAHAAGSLGGALLAILAVRIATGVSWRSRRQPLRQTLREGTRYASGAMVGAAHLELDKVLILVMVGTAALGAYTVGFRAASLALVPLAALNGVTLPRLFASQSTRERRTIFLALLRVSVAYGVVASILLAAASSYVPMVFGSDFADASRYVLLMAPWPAFYAVRSALCTLLTGSGKQYDRVAIESAGLVTLVAGCVLLLAALGPEAAIYSLICAEIVVVVLAAWRVAK